MRLVGEQEHLSQDWDDIRRARMTSRCCCRRCCFVIVDMMVNGDASSTSSEAGEALCMLCTKETALRQWGGRHGPWPMALAAQGLVGWGTSTSCSMVMVIGATVGLHS